MRLVDRHPHLDAHNLMTRFTPPARFGRARFDNYRPDVRHPTQAAALAVLVDFTTTKPPKAFWRRRSVEASKGIYLDGGYGVGKTHLLTAAWHQWTSPKAYVTFTELTSFIGFLGMANAVKALGRYDLLCIDEFELDDVANTLMVVSLLRSLSRARPVRIIVTSNTLPEKLGQQRFSAADFRREIAAIADFFTEVAVDGDDYRLDHAAPELRTITRGGLGIETHDDFDALLRHLRRVHPVQYCAMTDEIVAVTISGMHVIENQDDALLWVQFVDRLYDAQILVQLDADDVFHDQYRNGGYRKKYGRALSRMAAMRLESGGGHSH